MRIGLILLTLVYTSGIAAGLLQDYLQFRSAGGAGGFELVESLSYASFWPLRIVAWLA